MSDFVQNLGTALKPFAPQPTEHSAYRKYQDNRENKKERNQQNAEKDKSQKADNTTIISVKSAILYLEDLLEAKLNAKFKQDDARKDENNIPSNIQPWLKQNHSNQNQYAAQAYRSASISSGNLRLIKKKRQQEHHELKEIYSILKKLRDLKDRGILTITVPEQERFIDSIWQAVHSKD